MKRWHFLMISCSLWACSEATPATSTTGSTTSTTGSTTTGGGGGATTSSSSGGGGGAGGGQPTALRACLDSPEALPRPPIGALPCEYIPPGLTLGP